jgi:hypothetical protein
MLFVRHSLGLTAIDPTPWASHATAATTVHYDVVTEAAVEVYVMIKLEQTKLVQGE